MVELTRKRSMEFLHDLREGYDYHMVNIGKPKVLSISGDALCLLEWGCCQISQNKAPFALISWNGIPIRINRSNGVSFAFFSDKQGLIGEPDYD